MLQYHIKHLANHQHKISNIYPLIYFFYISQAVNLRYALCTCVSLSVCVYVCMYVCVCKGVCKFVCVCVPPRVCVCLSVAVSMLCMNRVLAMPKLSYRTA